MRIVYVDATGAEQIVDGEGALIATLQKAELTPETAVRTSPDGPWTKLGETEEFRQSAAAIWYRQGVSGQGSARWLRRAAWTSVVVGFLTIFAVGVSVDEPGRAGSLTAVDAIWLPIIWLVPKVAGRWLTPKACGIAMLVISVVAMLDLLADSLHLYREYEFKWMMDLKAQEAPKVEAAFAQLREVARATNLKGALQPEHLASKDSLARSRGDVGRYRDALSSVDRSILLAKKAIEQAADEHIRNPSDRTDFLRGMQNGLNEGAPMLDFITEEEHYLDRLDAVLAFCDEHFDQIHLQANRLEFADTVYANILNQLIMDVQAEIPKERAAREAFLNSSLAKSRAPIQ